MSNEGLYQKLRVRFPGENFPPVTGDNRRLVIELLKDEDEWKRRNGDVQPED
jgi:hypothetical protein